MVAVPRRRMESLSISARHSGHGGGLFFMGQWREQRQSLAKEQSNILIVWHRPTVRSNADIEGIRSAYKTQFDQESVMRVESAWCVSF